MADNRIPATLYDGEVIYFEPGTPEDVIDRVVKQETLTKRNAKPEDVRDARGVPGGTPAPAAERSTLDAIMHDYAPGPVNTVYDAVMDDFAPAVTAVAGPASRIGGFGARGGTLGAAGILGLPVDALNNAPRLLNLLPGDQGVGTITEMLGSKSPPIFGSEFNQGAVKAGTNFVHDLFSDEPIRWEPQTWDERLADRIGREVGAAAVPAAGIIGKAGRAGIEGANAMTTPVIGDMVRSAAVNPARFARNEAYIATGAGAGADAAGEIATRLKASPNKKMLADLFGALAGAGTFSLAGMGYKGIGNLFKALTQRQGYVDDVVRETVTDRIANAANIRTSLDGPIDTTSLVNTINNNPPISDVIPGVKETLADRTRNPGIANLEYGRQSAPESGGLFTQRRGENNVAIDAALQANNPGGSAASLADELLTQRRTQGASFMQSEQTATQAADASARGLGPRMEPTERGVNLRESLETSRDASLDELDAAWKPINESLQQVDLTPLAQTFDDATQALSVAERRRFAPSEKDIPGELSAVPEPTPSKLLGPDGKPLPPTPAPAPLHNIKEVTGLRSALSAAIAEAADKPGGAAEVRILQQYQNQIDAFLDTHIPDALKNQYQFARSLRVEHGKRFETPQTAVAQTLKEQHGQPRLDPSVVPRKFVQPEQGRVSDFQHLMREAGSDPRAQEAVRDQLRQMIKDRSLLQHPEEIASFVEQYKTVLDRFPDVRTELTGAGQQRTAATTAQQERTAFEKTHGTDTTSGTSSTGKYLTYGSANSKAAMRAVLGEKDAVKAADDLLNFANNSPDAIQGARKAFWDVLEEKARSKGGTTADIVTGEQPWLKGQLREFLKDPQTKAVMERLWRDNPEHVENVQKIVDAMQGLDTRLSAKAPNTSGTPQSILPPAEQLSSRYYARVREQVSTSYLVTSLGILIGRRAIKRAQAENINRMLDDALLDPSKAALLLKENNPANREALRTWAKTYLGNETSTIINQLSGEEKQDDIEDAINRGHSVQPGQGDKTGKREPLELTVTKPRGREERDGR